MKVERTTFNVEGIDEQCIIVDSGFVQVRISKCYHLIGKDTIYVRETVDGMFNSMEELDYDFDEITDDDAVKIAKEFSVYL